MLADILLVRLAGGFFDDPAEHAVAEIRVGVAAARREIERPAHHVTDDRLGLRRRLLTHRFCNVDRAKHRIERLVAIEAAGVMQELEHGDLVETRIDAGALLQMRLQAKHLEGGLVEANPAFLHELQHRGRRDRLGDAGDAEEGIRLHGRVGLAVGMPEAARVDKFAVSGYGQRGAGDLVLAHELQHHAIQRRKAGVFGAGHGDVADLLFLSVQRRRHADRTEGEQKDGATRESHGRTSSQEED